MFNSYYPTNYGNVLVGTCDGQTQSARACKPVLLHLALKTFLRSSREEKNLTNFFFFFALHSIALALPQQTQCSVWYPSAKQKTRTNPMFCLVPKCKAKNQRKERLRPLFFPKENPFVRADSAIENASRWSVIGRVGSAVENASRTPNHWPTDLVNLYIRCDT
jgi:hypothetical protein